MVGTETNGTQHAAELLAMVAHDLKNPLACILGYASYLLSSDIGESDRELALRRIVSACHWSMNMVCDLVDLSALEQGKLAMRPSLIVLADVVRESANLFQPVCRERGVALRLDLPSERGCVMADPQRVGQALHNLLSNALKYSAVGGEIRVSVLDVGNEISVAVADDGIGIAQEHLERVFDKFYQVTTENHGSLGLGLYVVRHIVESQGGRIGVNSGGLGLGATFRLSLPKIRPAAAGSRP